MTLTPEQLQILYDDIAADPVLSAYPHTPDGAWAIAEIYNRVWSPTFYVWRTGVSPGEIMQSQGFDWGRLDNLTAAKARTWDFMTRVAALNAAMPNVRAGFESCFSSGSDQGMRQSIYNSCQRAASRVEKLYATGPGTASNDHGVGPATMSFEGLLAYQDVQEARALTEVASSQAEENA